MGPEAAEIFRENLRLQQRVLGAAHPETLTTAGNLASTMFQQGGNAEAAQLLLETLDIRKRVLGENHPTTATNAKQLAIVLAEMSKEDARAQIVHETCDVGVPGDVSNKAHADAAHDQKLTASHCESRAPFLASFTVCCCSRCA